VEYVVRGRDRPSARRTKIDADTAKGLTISESRRITSHIAKTQLLEK
jgi:hypothetical protein